MQLRLAPEAQEKQRRLLEQQEKNSLLQSKLQYVEKQLSELNQKVQTQEQTLDQNNTILNQQKQLNQSLKDNQMELGTSLQKTLKQVEQLKWTIEQLQLAQSNLLHQNQHTLQMKLQIEEELTKNSTKLELFSNKYESLQSKKIQLEKQLIKDKQKLIKLQKQIRDIQTIIENQIKS